MQKIYIFLLISISIFACQSKNESVQQTQTSVSDSVNTIITKPFDFDDYTDTQLDSIYHVSKDSLLELASIYHFEKDTLIENYFSRARFEKAKEGFNDFVVVVPTLSFWSFLDSTENMKSFIYEKITQDSVYIKEFMTDYSFAHGFDLIYYDLSFDGKTDMVIKVDYPSASRAISIHHIFKNGNLNNINILYSTEEDTLLLNSKIKSLAAFSDGSFYHRAKEIYQWEKDELKLKKYIEWNANSLRQHLITVSEFIIKNNHPVKVKTWTTTHEKADDYFEQYW